MKWKTDIHSIGRKYSCAILLLFLLAAHLPFIAADPDINISFSRGPFTDEGLNTIQVRNWVNHGHLDLAECDNLLKTPLLGFSLAATYKIFGASLAVSRMHVLLLLLLAMSVVCIDRKHRGFMTIFILVTLFQYQVFQFSHFSLAEMLSSASVMLSIHFLARSADLQFSRPERRNNAVLAGVFLSLSYYFKIQFIYLAVLIPLIQLFRLVNSTPVTKRLVIRQGLHTSATLLAFLLLYLFAWYLPNRDTYDMMMAGQSGEFSISAKSMEYLKFNLMNFIFKGWFMGFAILFLVCLPAGIYFLLTRPSSRYPTAFIASLAWFLLESHKLLMVYLPTRYRISLYIAMGLLMSIVIGEILFRKRHEATKPFSIFVKGLAVLTTVALLAINGFNYFSSLERRSYTIKETNAYLAGSVQPDETVLGAWAPTLTWDAKARALPVWNNFLNYQDPVNLFKPRVIISETDEQDSEQAYRSQGINLQSLADSSRTVKIGQWEVRLYWMRGV